MRVDGGEACGRYTGVSPYQAASKAFSEFIRNRKTDGKSTKGKFTFTMVESTRGSSKKEHTYVGERKKLSEPVTYQVGGGKEITKEYKNNIKKVKKSV